MAISFNSISPTLRVPIVAVEFDSSQAAQGPAILEYTAFMFAQKLPSGSGVANSLNPVTSVDQVVVLCGRGSIAHRMAIGWFASNNSTALVIGILDDGGGVAATGTTTVTGAATEDGTIALYVGGVRITVGVTDGDSATDIADSISAAIIAAVDLAITTTNVAGVCTHLFRHAGEVGNSYDVRDTHLDGDPPVPAGITLVHVAIGDVIAGTVNPVLTTLIANMGDTWFQVLTHPYTDDTSLTAIEQEMASRFGPERMIDGVAFTSAAGTHGELTTLGNTRNSQSSSITAQPGQNPLTPPMEFGAEKAAIAARFLTIDPARPLQTLPMTNARPPADVDLFTNSERNLLLFDGIATTQASAGGIVRCERAITTWQTNAAGGADSAFLDVTTMFTLQYLRFSFRQRMLTKYPRHKLADDGTRFGAGQSVITPKLGRAEAMGWFREQEDLGLVEGAEQFKRDLVVERSSTDPNRLEFLLPPDLINQLIVTASQIAFRL